MKWHKILIWIEELKIWNGRIESDMCFHLGAEVTYMIYAWKLNFPELKRLPSIQRETCCLTLKQKTLSYSTLGKSPPLLQCSMTSPRKVSNSTIFVSFFLKWKVLLRILNFIMFIFSLEWILKISFYLIENTFLKI